MTVYTTETRRQRGRKVAAILAGGLVLGVGTMATLASWNDSEFANATFTAGKFNLVGAVDKDQSIFEEHASAGAAGKLAFTAPFDNLTPTDVVAAPFALRLAAGTTNDADVELVAAETTGDVANLTYQVVKTATAGCTETTGGTPIVPAGTPLKSAAGASPLALTMGADGGDGAPVYLCFKVTAGEKLTQGQKGSVTWEFMATSK